MGLVFDCVDSKFDEFFDDSRDAMSVVKELAIGKAQAVSSQEPSAVVIGGDTIVAFKGRQLGKPADETEARSVLRSYRDSFCEVISGVAVVYATQKFSEVNADVARVYFGPVPDEMIDAYIESGNYRDKGGSFAMQHPLARPMIDRIEGRIDTIIGLPTHQLYGMLARLKIPAQQINLQDKAFLSAANTYG